MANEMTIRVRTTGAVWVREAGVVLAASAFIALCARIQVPGLVPFTMQTFAVMLIAGTLGGRRSAAAVAAYLIEGAAGLPVFANGAAGLGYFAGPTGGYLAGFLVAAYVIGNGISRVGIRGILGFSVAYLVGHVIILSVGMFWLVPTLGIREAALAGFAPFLVTSVLKSALAAVATPAGRRLVGRSAV